MRPRAAFSFDIAIILDEISMAWISFTRLENWQGLDRAIEVAEAFDRSTDVDSSNFKRFYREFIKIEIELLGVLLKREYSNYSDEVKYLYGDETWTNQFGTRLVSIFQPLPLSISMIMYKIFKLGLSQMMVGNPAILSILMISGA